MKSLHVLSKVLTLTLLMSIPAQSNGQRAKPLHPNLPSVEMDMHPGERSFGAAGPAPLSERTTKPRAAKNVSMEAEMHPGEMPFRATGPEHRKPALDTAATRHLVKKLESKEELHDALKSHKNVAIKVNKGPASDSSFAKAVQANRGNVKAFSIDADNPAFKRFIEIFKLREFPSIIFVRTEVGSRTAEEFNKTLTDLTGNPGVLEPMPKLSDKEQKSEYHKHVKVVKNKKELTDALASHKNVSIKASTPWCQACTMSEGPFTQAVKAQGGNVKAFTFNADKPDFKEFMEMFKVPGYPTFVNIRTHSGSDDTGSLRKILADITGSTRIIRELESGQFGQMEKPSRRRRRERLQERESGMGAEEAMPESRFPRRRRRMNEGRFEQESQPMMRPGIEIL